MMEIDLKMNAMKAFSGLKFNEDVDFDLPKLVRNVIIYNWSFEKWRFRAVLCDLGPAACDECSNEGR